MRKQMKIAAVVSTAALLALGASMTSMAAHKGEWKNDGADWQCFNKDGEAYESTFCMSNGKEYYVGDDGYLVRSSWVEYDGEQYYINSAGTKTINDWRLVAPMEDEEADEEWYYFGSTGKKVHDSKKVINGKTYLFDNEGKMLTGWVDEATYAEASAYASTVFYCDETGARVDKTWVKTTAPGVDKDDTDASKNWYYLKGNAKIATGKQTNIKGQTYFFAPSGEMLTGWVATGDTTADPVQYVSISDKDYREDPATVGARDLSDFNTTTEAVYYCGDEDDGHMKKDKWISLWSPANEDAKDADKDKAWYYLDKDGKVYIPAGPTTWDKQELKDGAVVPKASPAVSMEMHKINGKEYHFNAEGEMVKGFFRDPVQNRIYYIKADGLMATGSQTISDDNGDDYKFYFETKALGDLKDDLDNVLVPDAPKYAGAIGNKNGKLYVDGQLVVAKDYKYEVIQLTGGDLDEDYYYIVNSNGSIQTSTSESSYKEDGDALLTLVDPDDKPVFITESGALKGALTYAEFSKFSVEYSKPIVVENIVAVSAPVVTP